MALVGWLLITSVAPGADIAWTNTAGGNWATAASWSPNQAPGPADNAYITNAGTYTVTVSGNAGVSTLTLGGSVGTQTLNLSGGTFSLNGPGGGSAHAVLNLSGGTLAGPGQLVLAGPLNWSYGTISGTVQCNGGSISGSYGNPMYLTGGTLINVGVLTLEGGTPMYTGSGSVISNLGTFNVAVDLGTTATGAGPRTIYNAGLFHKTAGGGVSGIADTFNNIGTVEADSGTLSLQGGGSNSGTNAATGTAILTFNGGTHTLDANSWITGNGTVGCSGGILNFSGACMLTGTNLVNGGTMNFSNATPVAVGTLIVISGTLGGSGVVSASGPLIWSSGTISGNVQCNGGSISGSYGNPMYLTGGTLINTGTMTLGGGTYMYTGSGSVISNLGTFNVAADLGTTATGTGPRTIYNAGLFDKTGGTGTSVINDSFNNTGTVQADSGTLSLAYAGTYSGTNTANGTAVLDFSGGTHNLSAGCWLAGSGTIRLSAATLNVNGPCAGAPSVVMSMTGGTLAGPGTLTLASPLNWTGGTISGNVQCNGGSISGSYGNPMYLTGGTLINTGTMTLGGGTYMYNGSGSVISNLGTFNVVVDVGTVANGSGPRTIYNAGLFRKTAGSGVSGIAEVFNNTGTVEADSGTLSLQGGGSNSGTNAAIGTGTLTFSGGTHTLGASSWITGTGTVGCSGGTVNFSGTGALAGTNLVNGGTMNFSNTTPAAVGAVTVTSGTLGGSGLVSASGPLVWSGGTISGNVQCNGGSISGSYGNPMYLTGGTLINTGTMTLGGGTYMYTGSGSVINNLGTFDVVVDMGTVANGSGPRTIYNAGLFTKSGGTGTSSFVEAFNNTATVEAASGTLSLQGGGSNSGVNTATGTATLTFSGGTHTLDANSRITGTGTVGCSGGTVSFSGTCAMAGTNLVNGGTMNFNNATPAAVGVVQVTSGTLGGSGLVSASGPLVWSGGTIGGNVQCNGGSISGNYGNPMYLTGGTLINTGTMTLGGGTYMYDGSGSVISNLGTFNVVVDVGTVASGGGPRTIYNVGLFRKSGGTGTSTFADTFNNTGVVETDSGILDLAQGCVQTAGLTRLLGGGLRADLPFNLDGGMLAGTNALSGNVTNSGGVVMPGTDAASPGVLTISGNYTENSNAVLQIELGGPLAGTGFSQLAVGGAAGLDGSLNASLTNHYIPSVGTVFPFLTCGSLAGAYGRVYYPSNDINVTLNYWPTGATLQITYLRAPPLITNIVALPACTQCLLSWQTTAPTLSQVEYGPTASYGSETPLTTQYATNQSLTLSNLAPNTTFYYRIHVFDTLGNEIIAGGLSFTTLPDTIPPQTILASIPNPVCALPLTLSWSGTDNATPPAGLVYAYRLDNQPWSAFGPATSLVLSQLADGPHTFSVKAQDAAGNVDPAPPVASFTVSAAPLTVSTVSTAPAPDHCAVSWQTGNPATSQVDYGATAAYGQTVSSTMLVTNHSLSLTGLQALTSYHFRVTSQDSCGRQASSADGLFTTPPAPDLQVIAISMPTQAWTGAAFDVGWTLTNAGGNVAVGPWVDRVYLSAGTQLDTNRDQLLGEFVFPENLSAGQSVDRVEPVTINRAGITNGLYHISVFTDATNSVFEGLAETNNVLVSPATFAVQVTPLPDLAVTLVTAPTNAMGNQTVEVSWTVCNQGGGDTDVPLWYDHLYLSPTTNIADAIADFGQFANPSYLAPGDCYEQNAQATLPIGVGGLFYFIVKADSTGLLLEDNRSNSVAATLQPINIQIVQPGFLHVESVQVAPAPPTAVWAGSVVTVTWTVQNTGPSSIGGVWDDEVTLSPTPTYDFVHGYWDVINHIYFTGPLAPGQSYTHTNAFVVPQGIAPGNWYAVPIVDPHYLAGGNGQIGGGNIGRDQNSTLVLVVPPPSSDLAVTSVSAPANAFAGQAITVGWAVTNQGIYPTDVSSWYDAVYLSASPVFDPAQSLQLGTLGHYGSLDLGAGYANSLSVTVPADVLPASAPSITNYLFVMTDAGNGVLESTKTNNVLAAPSPLIVQPVPPVLPADLAVTAVGAPGTVVAGRSATISWTVSNVGATPTSGSSWGDSVYLSYDTNLVIGRDWLVGTVEHFGSLGPGQWYQQSQVLPIPTCAVGQFYVQVVADSGHQVSGTGTLTNIVLAASNPTTAVPNSGARLEVSALSAPASVAAGAPLTLSWTVVNLGSATTQTPWTDALYLSTNAQYGLVGACLLGLYPQAGTLASGASYTQAPTVNVPLCYSGPWFVYVVTDVSNAVNAASCGTNDWRRSDTALAVLPSPFPRLEVAPITPPPGADSGVPWNLQWAVTNTGSAPATGAWSDAVYASTSPVLDATALLLGRFDYTNGLPAGGGYVRNQQLSFPDCLSGQFYIFVVADVDWRVNDTNCPPNNTACSTVPLPVNGSLYPDLAVSGLSFPSIADAGQALALSWTVTNAGLASAKGPWTDSVYLQVVGATGPGLFLNGYPNLSALDPGATYLQTVSVPLPSNLYGTFSVVVVTDSSNVVQECSGETNKVLVSAATVQIRAATYPAVQVSQVTAPATAWSGQNVAVSWVVANQGTGPTSLPWFDALYLASSQIPTPGTDLLLGTYSCLGALAVGQSYTNSATVAIPPSAAGPYYVLAVADVAGAFAAYGYEANNTWASSAPLLVSLPGPADLVATNVTLQPLAAVPGDTVNIGWTVLNQSTNNAPGSWTDAVFLSTNVTWDITALEVGQVYHSVLAPGAAYSAAWSGPLPGLTPGLYYALVRTDVRANVNDSNRGNNTAASLATISVDVPALTLGQSRTNWLNTGTAQYYKVNVPAGQTVQVTLTSASTRSANELYVRYGAAPDLGHYDFIYNHPLQPNQQILIPTTQAGWYYILVRGDNVPDSPAPYTIEADLIPFSITSVSPNNIGDNGQVTLTVQGGRFQAGASVTLASQSSTYTPDKIMFLDASTVRARFQFTNAVRGQYGVTLTNPDGGLATATNAVTIEPALPLTAAAGDYQVDLEPRIGTPFEWNGYVANQGNMDIPYLTVAILLDQDLPLTLTPPAEAVSLGTNAPDTTVFFLQNVPPGASLDFSFVVPDPGGQSLSLAIFPDPASRTDYLSDLADMAEELRQYLLASTNAATLPDAAAAALGDPAAWQTWFAQTLAATGLLDTNDLSSLSASAGPGMVELPSVPLAPHALGPKDVQSCYKGCLDALNAANAQAKSAFQYDMSRCVPTLVGAPPRGVLCVETALTTYALAIQKAKFALLRCAKMCQINNPPMCITVRMTLTDNEGSTVIYPDSSTCPRKPRDPNELQGPPGYSAAAFMGVQQPWLYTIYFQNVSNAAAYARQVLVTNKLEAGFDLRTFRLREIAFGNVTISVPTNRCFYQTRVALPPPHATNVVADVTAGVDLENGLVFWTLNAIDLNTGQLVESAQEGILPPDDATHAGEGHVIYTILPASGVATGTVITNQATIVFDINAPLDTNPTTNTVDAVPPSSTVAALPASLMDTNFTVAWFGTDDPGGSGLSRYDVYVSDNGGPWAVWQSGVTANNATYSGQPGHYYFFYSRAWDSAGNVEPAPATYQAQTFISDNHPPTLQPLADQTAIVNTRLVVTNSASDPDAGQQLTFSLTDAPAGASIDPARGTIQWTPLPRQGSTTNLFTVMVTDNGLPPLSASQSFLVVVGDYVELDVGSGDLLAGHSGCVPLRLVSTATLTNLSFTLGIPPGRLSNLSISPSVPQVAQAQLVPLDPANAQVILSAGPAPVLSGTQTLASVCFDTLPTQPSFVAELAPRQATARTSDGRSLTNLALFPGRLVVVATQPMIQAAALGTNQLQLTLYGRPAVSYSVESSTDLRGPWSPVASLTLTNEMQTLFVPIQGAGARFFRLHQQ